ncbi:hypothetical protein [Methanolobus halotolerans]|uniref:Uncharacterized protein n=1 Tax=Methanolobus halotolerans TaxID=2052935 RepID=A0A4E0Q3R3_9EURY|nr:hypothetical protein [Methanolobus halotolerans]TGC08148.1 hypothetical protein CUN85_10025 [Methanolobus halotolerans]
MKQDLVRILRDIFSSAGYNVADSHKHDFIAEKNNNRTYIRLSSHPDIAEIKNFVNQMADGEGLYVVTDRVGSDILQYAQAAGLKVWNRDDMSLQIGRAVVADIEGSASELDLLNMSLRKNSDPAASDARPAETSNADEIAKMAVDAIFGNGGAYREETPSEEGSLLSRYSERSPEPVTISAPVRQQRDIPDTPPQADGILLNLRSAPVNMTREHAVSAARSYVYDFKDILLKLVPFWKYDYHLSTEQRYRSKIVDISGEGSGCINALNGNNEQLMLHEIRETVSIPDVRYEVKHPLTTEEEARKDLLDSIIDEHTKDLRFDNTQGEAIISEHKRFKPVPDDIELNVKLVYVPVWEIKGQRNSVEINAYNSEVLRNPVDDDAEFV